MHDRHTETFSVFSILKSSQWKKHPGTCFFISVLIFLYIYIGLKLVSPRLQRRSIAQFHLTSSSFLGWAVTQPVPSMYNFANEVWIGNRPKNAAQEFPATGPVKHYYTWLNHYPLRIVTFNWHRSMIFTDKDYKYISLRTTYQNTFVETCYYLNAKEGRVFMERVY